MNRNKTRFVMLHDLDSGNGKSYKEVNAEKQHKYSVGDLVELWSHARMFVVKQTRDCDMTPLYCLSYINDEETFNVLTGISEESITQKIIVECKKCYGVGELDDNEGQGMFCNKWECPECKGSGVLVP